MILETPYKSVFENEPSITAVITPHGDIFDINDAFILLSGHRKEEILNQPYWELPCWVHSDEMQNRVLFALEEAALTTDFVRFEAKYKDYYGNINDLDLRIKAVYDQDENVECFIAYGYNVTELVRARRALSNQERQLSALFNHSKDGYIFNILPSGLVKTSASDLKAMMNDSIRYLKVVEINKALKDIMGVTDWNQNDMNQFYDVLMLKGRQYRKCVEEILNRGEYKFEHRIVNYMQQPKFLEVTLSSIESEDTFYGFFGVVRDLTIQKAYEEELEFYANNDPLTSLRNRRYYFNKLEKNNLCQEKSYICMFDLDHFKKINDTYGHDVGDLVLVKFAELAKTYFSPLTEVCRYGGEEFLVYVPIEEDAAILDYLDKFRIAASELDFVTELGHFNISLSMGFAPCEKALGLNTIISNADKALYYSKRNGRNQVNSYYNVKSDI